MSDSTGHWRLVAGVVALAAAAIVGLVGYLRLSLEPSLNHQIPYLASAGMALVVLCTIGGCLIVSDVVRRDSARTEELALAIQRLADALAPDIERPSRREPPAPMPR